jgi:ankyrin repeat protein
MLHRKALYIMVFLLSMGCHLNATAPTTEKDVLIAINSGVDATKKFLKKVPTYQLYEKNKTILHYAVELNKYKVVEFLTKDRMNLARRGGIFSQTPLQDAIYYRHFRIAKLLISRGSPLNTKNINGETALHIAAKHGYTDMVKALLDAGAATNISDEDGNLPYELVPELMFENSKALVENLKPKIDVAEYENSGLNDVITIDASTRHRTRTITIDGRHKTIDDRSVDDKSKLQNSNVGILIN